MTGIIQILVGLLVLGVLIIIHELGHFLMAKRCGIRVLAFSIGFGPVIGKKTIGETEYRLSAIPFGGYVHMAGEHPEDEQQKHDDEFTSKPVWQRMLVAVAGPAANYVFAALFILVAFMYGVERERYLDNPVVGAVEANSLGEQAGIMPGDSIVAIGNRVVVSWDDIYARLGTCGSVCPVDIMRNGIPHSLQISFPERVDRQSASGPIAGLFTPLPPRIGAITPGSAAEAARIQPQDVVVAINDQKIYSWFQISTAIASFDTARGAMRFEIKRNGEVLVIESKPEFNALEKRFMMGMAVEKAPTQTVRYALPGALRRTGAKTWEYTTMIFDMLGKLVSAQVPAEQLAGPVGIIQMSGIAAFGGLVAMLNFMALIGINLAVLNLFPLIITDGGLMVFLIIEAIRGKPLSLKTQLIINRIAITAFIMLFLFVTFNDARRVPMLFRMLQR